MEKFFVYFGSLNLFGPLTFGCEGMTLKALLKCSYQGIKKIKGSKSALTELLLFCTNAPSPNNFLERELGMKIGVSGGLHFPIHFPP